MTTDEALEYCKRFDDPKLQSAMATDFSRATGTVGALLALRAELETMTSRWCESQEAGAKVAVELNTLRGKLRELDVWAEKSKLKIPAWYDGQGVDHTATVRLILGTMRERLRELGLLEVNDESSHE